MTEISPLNFNRKGLIKHLRKKFELYLVTCGMYKINKVKEADNNFKTILKMLNIQLLKPDIFDNNKITLYLTEIQHLMDFLKDYESAVKNTDSIQILEDSSIKFFGQQTAFIKKLERGMDPYQCLVKIPT